MSLRTKARRILESSLPKEEEEEKSVLELLGISTGPVKTGTKSLRQINKTLLRNVYRPPKIPKDPIAKYTKIRTYERKKEKEKPDPQYYFELHKKLRVRRKR